MHPTKLHTLNPSTESPTIRPAVDADIEDMRALLNEIIRVGGTTAITNELSPDDMLEWFISGDSDVGRIREASSASRGTRSKLICPLTPSSATGA